MQQDSHTSQVIELTKEIPEGVQFDPEAVSLLGIYRDELSLQRAKKNWTQILEANFLLEPQYDYTLSPVKNAQEQHYVLQCQFLTACGRYAFWRLTNDQAPEAQYLIETAHIACGELKTEDFVQAPDLKPISTSAIIPQSPEVPETSGLASRLDLTSIREILDTLRQFIFRSSK